MEEITKWITDNVILCSMIGVGLTFIIVMGKSKIQIFGFVLSQWIRRVFGKKLEKAVEDAVDALGEGLKSDNDK